MYSHSYCQLTIMTFKITIHRKHGYWKNALPYHLKQWFPNCEPQLPWEPWFPRRGAAQFFKNLSFFLILFQFGDIYTLQSILDIWSHMLIYSAIMYDSFGTRLHPTK